MMDDSVAATANKFPMSYGDGRGIGYSFWHMLRRDPTYYTPTQLKTALRMIEYFQLNELSLEDRERLLKKFGLLGTRIIIECFARGHGFEKVEKKLKMPIRSLKIVLVILLDQLKDWPDV